MNIKSYLCHYDLRNPNGISDILDILEDFEDAEELKSYGNFRKKDCACDNCYYGRTKLAEYALTLEEQFNEEL